MSPPTSTAPPQLTDAELRERMSGNICRCGAYSNIVDAITEVAGRQGMKPFTYERATLAGRSRGGRGAHARRQVHRRRHQPARPDEARDRDAGASDRRERPRRSTGSKPTPEGGLRIGALVRNTDLAADARVRRDYGVLSRALLAGASGQLRNKATTAGNLLQRTRCPYFYDTNQPCNKRKPGSGCAAIGGFSRQHAVVGASDACIATHPSDMAVAMRALDATVETVRPDGATRAIPIADFHRLPGDTPHIETVLRAGRADHRGDAAQAGRRHAHLSQGARPRLLRLRAGLGRARSCSATARGRVALGGVAHKPWRVEAAEAELPRGAKAVAAQLLAGAKPTHDNAFKLPLVERTLAAVLAEARG